MVLSLLYGRKYAQSRVGTVSLDATLSEDHSYRSRVTNFPIENGTYISDHVINEPVRLSIRGLVSDTPLNILAIGNRSIDAFNRLIEIQERKERISVITGIKVYTDMVITSLNVPRDIATGQSLTFNIEFQKLMIDTSVRLYLNQPFEGSNTVIPREIVADATKYPFIGNIDPVTSLKDQASSGVNVGIQSLQPVPNGIIDNVRRVARSLAGFGIF